MNRSLLPRFIEKRPTNSSFELWEKLLTALLEMGLAVRVCAYTHVYTYGCMYTRVYTCLKMCVKACMHACWCVCLFGSVCTACVCSCSHMHTWVYMCTYACLTSVKLSKIYQYVCHGTFIPIYRRAHPINTHLWYEWCTQCIHVYDMDIHTHVSTYAPNNYSCHDMHDVHTHCILMYGVDIYTHVSTCAPNNYSFMILTTYAPNAHTCMIWTYILISWRTHPLNSCLYMDDVHTQCILMYDMDLHTDLSTDPTNSYVWYWRRTHPMYTHVGYEHTYSCIDVRTQYIVIYEYVRDVHTHEWDSILLAVCVCVWGWVEDMTHTHAQHTHTHVQRYFRNDSKINTREKKWVWMSQHIFVHSNIGMLTYMFKQNIFTHEI